MLRRAYKISVAIESAFAARVVKEFPVYLQCTKVGFSDGLQLTRIPPAYLPHVFVIFQQIFINDLLTKIIFSPIPLLPLYPHDHHYVYGVSDRRKTPLYPFPTPSPRTFTLVLCLHSVQLTAKLGNAQAIRQIRPWRNFSIPANATTLYRTHLLRRPKMCSLETCFPTLLNNTCTTTTTTTLGFTPTGLMRPIL